MLQVTTLQGRSYGHSQQSLSHEFVVRIETRANKSQKLPKDIQLKEDIHPQCLVDNKEQPITGTEIIHSPNQMEARQI